MRTVRPICEQKMTPVRGVGHSQKQGIPLLCQRAWRRQELLIEWTPVLAVSTLRKAAAGDSTVLTQGFITDR